MNLLRPLRQRPLLWLLLILTVSQLVLSVFNSVIIARLDASYSSLVSNDIAFIGDLRNVSRQSAEIQRSLLNLVIGYNAEETAFQKQKLQNARRAHEGFFNKLAARHEGHSEMPKFEAFSDARKKYLDTVEVLIGLLEASKADAAAEYRIKTLRPAYDTYQQIQDDLADAAYQQAEVCSQKLSSQSSRWRVFTVSLASLPLLLGLIVSSIIFALILWVKSPTDEP